MKKTLLTILQIAVTVGILWLIFRDPAKRAEMGHALSQAKPGWMIAAVLMFGAVVVSGTARWGLLLKVQGIVFPKLQLAALFMIGLFFNFFMPGGTGGDVVKIFYLIRATPHRRAAAVLATLVDRVLGLFTLILIAAVLIGIRYDDLVRNASPAALKVFYSFMVILAASIGGVVTSFVVAGMGLASKLPAKFPGRTMLVDLSVAYNAYAKAWRVSLGAIGLSAIVHFFSFFVFYCAARSLNESPPLLDFLAKLPIIQTIASLPLSLAGVGMREWLFAEFFPAITPAKSNLIGTCGFLATLVWGLIGGVVYLVYRPVQHASIQDMEAIVEKVEERIAGENPPGNP